MNTDELGQKIKDLFSKGAKVSKEAFEKAGDKVQEFTDKSVIKIEKKQLENKLEDKYTEMGKDLEKVLLSATVTFAEPESQEKFNTYLHQLSELKNEIHAKEDLLHD